MVVGGISPGWGHLVPDLALRAEALCNGEMEQMEWADQVKMSWALMCPTPRVWNELFAPIIAVSVVMFVTFMWGQWIYKKNILDYKSYVTYPRLKNLAPTQKIKENSYLFRENIFAICAHPASFILAIACPYMRLLDSFLAMDVLEEEELAWHIGCITSFPACYLCCYAPYYRTKMRQRLGSKMACSFLDCIQTFFICGFGIAQLARVSDKATGVGTAVNCTMYEMSSGQPIAKPIRIKEKRTSLTEQ